MSVGVTLSATSLVDVTHPSGSDEQVTAPEGMWWSRRCLEGLVPLLSFEDGESPSLTLVLGIRYEPTCPLGVMTLS